MKNEACNEPCNDDFEPYCKWREEKDTNCACKETHILEIHLPGFKKEELRLELENDFLCICGQRSIGKNLKRFNKKIDVSNYEINEDVHQPVFENGILRMTLPRKSSAICFCVGEDKETVGILFSKPQIFKKIKYCAVVPALLFLVAIYVYFYLDCNKFLNWFKCNN